MLYNMSLGIVLEREVQTGLRSVVQKKVLGLIFRTGLSTVVQNRSEDCCKEWV